MKIVREQIFRVQGFLVRGLLVQGSRISLRMRALSSTLLLAVLLSLILYSSALADTGMTYTAMIQVAERISKDLLEGRESKAIQEVERLIKDRVRSSTNDIAAVPILNLVFEQDAHRYEGIVQKLVEHQPNSATARLLKAKFYQSYAWQARGEKFISNTAAGAIDIYRERLKTSTAEYKEVLRLAPKSYIASHYLFQLSKEVGFSKAESDGYFAAATKTVPFFLSTYLAKVDALAPKWGGSEGEMFRFVADNAWQDEPNSSLPFIVQAAHANVCREHGGKKDYYSQPAIWSEIERSYELLLKRFPQAAYFRVMYAKDLIVVGKKPQGLAQLRVAAELEPNHPEVLAQLEKFPEILQGARPDNTEALSRAEEIRAEAKARYRMKDWPEAERLYTEVVRLDPTDAHSWYLLGFIQDKNGDYKTAIINFDRAINLRPKKATYYTYRCHSKMMDGQIEAGINDCTKAISIDTREKYAYLNRAHAYQMIGKMKEAEEDLRIGNALPE